MNANSAMVPASWLHLGYGWNARFLVEIAVECERLGIDKNDLGAVRAVAYGITARRRLSNLVAQARQFT